ncbi:hypothetical protein GGR54DRAFT_648016 [Hypoxylon sp. NC1633]|nr:hypothetical protein GGR54DRAFT_648016 [Hypoxylon sp. NC1633]
MGQTSSKPALKGKKGPRRIYRWSRRLKALNIRFKSKHSVESGMAPHGSLSPVPLDGDRDNPIVIADSPPKVKGIPPKVKGITHHTKHSPFPQDQDDGDLNYGPVVDQVMAVFPDISRSYVELIVTNGEAKHVDAIISTILDRQEKGNSYPTKSLKRKRVDEDEEAEDKDAAEEFASATRIKVESVDMQMRKTKGYDLMARTLIAQEYAFSPFLHPTPLDFFA